MSKKPPESRENAEPAVPPGLTKKQPAEAPTTRTGEVKKPAEPAQPALTNKAGEAKKPGEPAVTNKTGDGVKKPGDETIPWVGGSSRDSFTEKEELENSAITGIAKTPSGSQRSKEAAPEVSQGAWRERVFTPRGVMSKDEITGALEGSLRAVLASANHVKVAFEEVRRAWLPILRQALEQSGGDGVDVFLVCSLKPPGRTAMDPLFRELVTGMENVRKGRDLAHFEEEAIKVVELVRRVMSFDKPRRLSFKQMERELEGKLEVDELLAIAFADDGELTRREREIASTMEQLRDQIRSRPGNQPDGMYSNFVRLKAEFRILDAELKRRAPKH